MKKYGYIFIFFFAFSLTACREQIDLHLKSDQRWRMNISITVDQALMDMFLEFGGNMVTEELGFSVPPSALESENWIGIALDMMISKWEQMGIEADWSQARNNFSIQLAGQTHAQLSAALHDTLQVQTIKKSPETYRVTGNFAGSMEDLSLYSFGYLDYEQVVNIYGGKIIDCNGCQIERGKATWYNPQGTISATLTPEGKLPLVVFLGLFSVAFLIAIIIVVAKRASGTLCPVCDARVPKGQDVCPQCGTYVDIYNFDEFS